MCICVISVVGTYVVVLGYNMIVVNNDGYRFN
jgi:hypothetical protein